MYKINVLYSMTVREIKSNTQYCITIKLDKCKNLQDSYLDNVIINGIIKEILKRYLGLKFILMNCKFCKIGIY